MEKHISLTGTFNIVYRAIVLIESIFLFALSFWFGPIIRFAIESNPNHCNEEIPIEVLNIISPLLFIIASVIFIVSLIGIIGSIGVLRKKNWGRLTLLVISFLNLLRIPFGTALGIYSIWVLMHNDTIKLFDQDTNKS